MESNMTSLSADDYLFERADAAVANQEKFGYVFAPMTAPLVYKRFEATTTEQTSDLCAVYKAMEATSDDEIGALLWHKAILLRCVLGAKQQRQREAAADNSDEAPVVLLPARICAWLFNTSASVVWSVSVCGSYVPETDGDSVYVCVWLVQWRRTVAATLSAAASVTCSSCSVQST